MARRGRKKNKQYLPYDEAKAYVQSFMIPSRNAYFDWHDHERPSTIPKRPNRVYKEWVSWNDFLGNDNKFDPKQKTYRPYKEAVAYVHTLNIKSYEEWKRFCRDNGDQIPEDIPRNPYWVYRNHGWMGWSHWLGSNVTKRVEAQQQIEDIAILYVIHFPYHPSNVVKVGVEKTGKSAIQDRQQRHNFKIIKLFKHEPDYDWYNVLLRFGSEWWEEEGFYVMQNLNGFLFELSCDLLIERM